MNEQQKRLIEAERRIARLESTLHRTNVAITSVQGATRNDSYNVPNPFGTGGGGGTGSGIKRFPTTYRIWVEWDTEPALITGASSNVPADGPSLAEAVDYLATVHTYDASEFYDADTVGHVYLYDTNTSQMAQYLRIRYERIATISGRTNYSDAELQFAYYNDGSYLADAENTPSSENQFEGAIDPAGPIIGFLKKRIFWPRRNALGSFVGYDTLSAFRLASSDDEFTSGPTYGETGTWSFAMTCLASSYHTAGSGTIYLEWGSGAGEMSIVSGGTPESLPADIISGGTPASLPTDIIDGGVI